MTGGGSQVEGAGGGGLNPWATITGYGTDKSYGANVFYTEARLPDFTLKSVGGSVGIKNRLEIDFKSSADPRAVIDAIRDADMTDQVLLIAYNPEQAALFERLAPEMLRSNPTAATQKGHAVWLGYGVANGGGAKAQRLKKDGNYIIGRIGDPNRQPPLKALIDAADILVSDNAEKHEGIIGLTAATRAAYESCLAE